MTLRPHEQRAVPVIHTAILAGGSVAEGRFVPYLVLDTTQRPDIEQLILSHEHLPSGDVNTTWAKMPGQARSISLLLEFKRPAEIFVRLEFGITEWGGLVDQIMRARLIYLQAGKPGDHFDPSQSAPHIIAEILGEPPEGEWDRLLMATLVKDFRTRGLKRKEANIAAREMVRDWRNFSGFRLTPTPAGRTTSPDS